MGIICGADTFMARGRDPRLGSVVTLPQVPGQVIYRDVASSIETFAGSRLLYSELLLLFAPWDEARRVFQKRVSLAGEMETARK